MASLWRIIPPATVALVLAHGLGAADAVPPLADSKNIELIGYHDLQGRDALQVAVMNDATGGNGRYVYVGLHPGKKLNPLTGQEEFNGTMVIDIADPRKPRTVAHIPNSVLTNSRAVQVVYDYGPDRRDYLIRNHESKGIWKFEIFDITERDRKIPKIVKVAEITGTPEGSCGPGCGGVLQSSAHKGWWSPKSGIYYAAANEPGFRGGMDSSHLIIWDLTDPSRPAFLGRWWTTGQKLTEDDPGQKLNLHHPIVDEERSRVYAGFHRGGDVVAFDIAPLLADRVKDGDPKPAWRIDLQPPGAGGAHTVATVVYGRGELKNFGPEAFPRTYALVAEEAGVECGAIRPKLYMLDVTSETSPLPVSTWQVPDGDFCGRGGRFGPHQFAETINGKINRFTEKLAWVAYFNAGVRLIDLRDPYRIEERGYFIPRPPTGLTRPSAAIQINDVDLDERGFAYAVDREGAGMYVLRAVGTP